MKPLSKHLENAIKLEKEYVKDNQFDVKRPTHCRFCGVCNFKKKKVPPYRGTPPLKVGVVCLECGETTVISFHEFFKYHAIKGKK